MDYASGAETIGDEKKSANTDRSRPILKDIIPETKETQGLDLEKGLAKANANEKPEKPGMIDPNSFPDGGWEAWLAVSGAFCCLFCSFGWINAIGVFQAYYETHQLSHYSASTIAWIPAFQTFMMFAGGPIWGKVYDNHGPRYLLLLGSFLHVFGLMMASISTKYYQFLLSQGICSPLGASLVFYPALSSVGTWFFKRRAFAFGVMAAGSSLGGVIFPIMVETLVVERGFGWSMRAAAFLILGLLIYANLTVKSRLPPQPKPWNIMDFIKPLQEVPFLITVLSSFLFFFGMVITFLIDSFLACTNMWATRHFSGARGFSYSPGLEEARLIPNDAQFIPFTFIILSAEYNGMSANLAGYLLAVLNAVSIFGRTLPGFIADRLGRYNTMVVTSFLSTILVLALWLPARGNVPYILFAAFYGFSSGAFVSLAPALIAQISDIRQIGVRTGTMFAIISIAALVSTPIAGALVAAEGGSYLHLEIFCGVMMLAGSCMFVVARASLQGLKIKKKV